MYIYIYVYIYIYIYINISSALVSARGFLKPYCEIKIRHLATFSLEPTRYDILNSLMSGRISTLEVQKKHFI